MKNFLTPFFLILLFNIKTGTAKCYSMTNSKTAYFIADFLKKESLPLIIKLKKYAIDTPKTDTPKTDTGPVTVPKNDLSGFGSYNFGGGNTGFTNPQAEAEYGFHFQFTKVGYIEFRPSIATAINAGLSKYYIPALLLPSAANININTFFPLGNNIIISPINFGLKFLGGFTDSAKTIIQHNIRTGITFSLSNLMLLQAQYTWGWHNSTDDSQRNYEYVFKNNNSSIQYLTLTLQGRVSASNAKTPSYIIIQWRGLTNPGQFPGLQNFRIFTIGFAATLNKSIGLQAK